LGAAVFPMILFIVGYVHCNKSGIHWNSAPPKIPNTAPIPGT